MNRRLEERAAVVTGAANGIGRAVTSRFVAEGARVAAIDVERDTLAELVGALSTHHVLGLVADVTDPTRSPR